MSTKETETTERQQGPFEDTTTRTYEIAPVKITITEQRKSTHVPPVEKPCGCGGGLDIASLLGGIGSGLSGGLSGLVPAPADAQRYATAEEVRANDEQIKRDNGG